MGINCAPQFCGAQLTLPPIRGARRHGSRSTGFPPRRHRTWMRNICFDYGSGLRSRAPANQQLSPQRLHALPYLRNSVNPAPVERGIGDADAIVFNQQRNICICDDYRYRDFGGGSVRYRIGNRFLRYPEQHDRNVGR